MLQYQLRLLPYLRDKAPWLSFVKPFSFVMDSFDFVLVARGGEFGCP